VADKRDENDKALAVAGAAAVAAAPAGGMSPAAVRRAALTGITVLPAMALVLGLYGGGLTVGALFLAAGWMSLVGAAWMIYRAASAFDVAPADEAIIDQALLDDEQRAQLQHEKKILLKAIKEIEFDQQMGKLDETDAAQVSQTYRTRALEIMRLLDQHKPADYAAQIEKEVARRLTRAGVKAGAAPARGGEPAAEPVAEPEAPALTREVETGASAAAPTCAGCGTKNDVDAIFCKKCGAKVSA
jgi:hypothetical protein